MVQGRWRKISYKINKVRATRKEEWIYGGEFKGIVSKEIFEQVQNSINKRAKNYRYKGQSVYIFSTVLKCNECGGSMSYRKKFQGYKCTNSQMGGGRCTAHSLKEDKLKDIIVANLRECILRELDSQDIYNKINKFINKKENYHNKIKTIENELKKSDRQFQELYLDKFNGKVSERNFEILTKALETKQHKMIMEKNLILEKLEVDGNYNNIYEGYKNEIDKILSFQNLDREMVESLIEKIIISEDKQMKQKSIDIFYKFKT